MTSTGGPSRRQGTTRSVGWLVMPSSRRGPGDVLPPPRKPLRRGKTCAPGDAKSVSASAPGVMSGTGPVNEGNVLAMANTHHLRTADDRPGYRIRLGTRRGPGLPGVRDPAQRLHHRADPVRGGQGLPPAGELGPLPGTHDRAALTVQRAPDDVRGRRHRDRRGRRRRRGTLASAHRSSASGCSASSSTSCSSPGTTTWHCGTPDCSWRPSPSGACPPSTARGPCGPRTAPEGPRAAPERSRGQVAACCTVA